MVQLYPRLPSNQQEQHLDYLHPCPSNILESAHFQDSVLNSNTRRKTRVESMNKSVSLSKVNSTMNKNTIEKIKRNEKMVQQKGLSNFLMPHDEKKTRTTSKVLMSSKPTPTRILQLENDIMLFNNAMPESSFGHPPNKSRSGVPDLRSKLPSRHLPLGGPSLSDSSRSFTSSSTNTTNEGTTVDTCETNLNPLETREKQDDSSELEEGSVSIRNNNHGATRFVSSRCLFREDGGFSMLDGCVVLSDNGLLGCWTGFNWKQQRQISGWDVSAITHDTDGNLWSLNHEGKLAQLTSKGWISVGLIGNRELKDITFDLHRRLWGVTRKGEIGVWNGYTWSEKHVKRFKKTTCISCDRLGNIWVLSASQEIAKWDQQLREWDIKIFPPGIKPRIIAFDSFNCLWGVMSNGQIAQISENQWIFLGYVNGWHIQDISFRWKSLDLFRAGFDPDEETYKDLHNLLTRRFVPNCETAV